MIYLSKLKEMLGKIEMMEYDNNQIYEQMEKLNLLLWGNDKDICEIKKEFQRIIEDCAADQLAEDLYHDNQEVNLQFKLAEQLKRDNIQEVK